jgi:threonine aldolase
MYTYSFFNDYSEGAHPAILDILSRTNLTQEMGYGADSLTAQAIALLRQALAHPDADIHFIAGGTHANLTVLASMLRPHESVISATSGHINVHEAGAIEATGHRISTVQVSDGKLTPDGIRDVLDCHTDEHMVKPKAVFISNASELGTVYTRRELETIAELCHSRNVYLYMDGARLGSALCSRASDLRLSDLCELTDAFYIGGTKNGALLGEAIVLNHHDIRRDFRYHLKQRGGMLAKGRVISAQFIGLFTDGLFFDLARHANQMAEQLGQGIRALGYGFMSNSTSNMIFPLFPDAIVEGLRQHYGFEIWGNHINALCPIRLVCSWATPVKCIDQFLCDLAALTASQNTTGA